MYVTSAAAERSALLNLFWEDFRFAYNIDSIQDSQTVAQLPAALVQELVARAQELQHVYSSHPVFSSERTRRSRPAPQPAPSAGGRPAGR